MKGKSKWLIFFSIIAIFILIFGFMFYKISSNKGEIIEVGTKRYDATDAINKAMSEFKKNNKADIISDIKTLDKVVSLTFSGLSDPDTNNQILELLEQYNRKGTFFLPGILAAEDTNTVYKIHQYGHYIANNTLKSQKHMEHLSTKELINDFTTSSHIIECLVKEKPSILLCSSTAYSEDILKAAYASGYENVLESKHFLNYQSFTNYEQVLNYVKGLSRGSILTIKLDGVLDEFEYGKVDAAISPVENEQADVETEEESLSQEARLIQVLEWILKALEEADYKSVFVSELSSFYDPDLELSFDDLREHNGGKLAKVYKKINTNDSMMAFSFRGLLEEEMLDKVLAFLYKYRIKATFFVTAQEIVEEPDKIHQISDAGHHIANGGMTGKDVTKMDFDEVTLELYKCDKLLKEIYDIETDFYMPVYGKYNDTVLEAASALGYKVITYNKNPIIDENQSFDDIMDYYKNGFKKGEIIFFRLDYHKDLIEVIEGTLMLALEKNYKVYDLKRLWAHHIEKLIENNLPNHEITDGKKPNDSNIEKDKYTDSDISELRKQNNKKKADIIKTVYTTEESLSFTFYGISNRDVLLDVLEKLNYIDGKGTFFVTEKDLKENKKAIEDIANEGHELGICLSNSSGTSYEAVTRSILSLQDELKTISGVKPTLVRYPYEVNVTDEILESISSTGCTLVWQDISIANSNLGKDASLDDIINNAFHEGNITVRRGYIIYFRMDYYEDKSLIGKLLLNIYNNRIKVIAYQEEADSKNSSYKVKWLGEIMRGDKVYSYPVQEKDMVKAIREDRKPGYLSELSPYELFQYMQGRYIGTPTINNHSTFPGFHDIELGEMDKSGRFTEDKVLFLTFDDWGSDKTINQLLYVLDKYDVSATFYARTNYIEQNPNLLRAIAEAGHDVGSHSDEHYPFAISNNTEDEIDTSKQYSSLTKEEIELRRKDLTLSYNKLKSIIGDIEIDGTPALTKTFRPPTLAMSKEGIHTILDAGFSYIVSGDFSTRDYEDTDPRDLIDKFLNGISLRDGSKRTLQNGSIIILHMSDDSKAPTDKNDVTAEALDIVLPKLLEQGYRFAKISEYLNDDSGEVFSLSEEYINWSLESKN